MYMTSDFSGFDKEHETLLFFTPEAKLTPHIVVQCILAKALQDRGYQVLMTRCRGQFSRCPVIDSVRSPYSLTIQQQHQSFCQECVQHFDAIVRHYGLPIVDLATYTTAEHMETARSAIASFTGHPLEFEFENVKWGYLGASEFSMMNKHSNMDDLSPEQRQAWGIHTANGILSFLSVRDLCEDLSVKRICTHNPYMLNVGTAVAAGKLGIPYLNTGHAAHHDIDRQRIRIVPTIFTLDCFYKWAIDWYRWRDLSLPGNLIEEIVDDSIVRQFGKGAQHYSPAKAESCESLYDTLNLDRKKKTLVAYTSSLDEYKASSLRLSGFDMEERFRREPFDNHIEWLTALVDYVEASDDLQLVVRIHPRESANKRENKVSQHLGMLKERFEKEWENCRFVWPLDQVSSYNLAELADLVLTSWSTIGIEMARLGVPVITAYRHYNCVDDDFLAWGGADPDEYFSTIRKRLAEDVSFEQVLRAVRCYSYMTLSIALELDDVVPSKEFSSVPETVLHPRRSKEIEEVFIHGREVTTIQLQELKDRQSEALVTEERETLFAQMSRLVHFYSVGENVPENFSMHFLNGHTTSETEIIEIVENQSLGTNTAVFCWSGKDYVYYFNGAFYRKHSALVTRIAQLLLAEPEAQHLEGVTDAEASVSTVASSQSIRISTKRISF